MKTNRPLRSSLQPLLLALAMLVLAGCAQQRLRDESELLMREAKYEQAVKMLESGVAEYPDSTPLRSTLLQAKNAALVGLTAQAGSERAAGRFEAAETLLRRAKAFDASGKRVAALLADVAVERRQAEALQRATAFAEQQPPDVREALRIVQEALKDNPKHNELMALQRRLSNTLRRSQVQTAQLGLAEARPISLDFRDASL